MKVSRLPHLVLAASLAMVAIATSRSSAQACDLPFASCPATMVMATQTGSSFAYYFNATWLGGSTYLSLFDAEKWNWQETGDATGDSTAAVKIVADPTAPGTFGTHVANQNILIG